METANCYSPRSSLRRRPQGLPTIEELAVFAPQGEEFVRGRLRHRSGRLQRTESVSPSTFERMLVEAEEEIRSGRV
jgi:hypothetical protein